MKTMWLRWLGVACLLALCTGGSFTCHGSSGDPTKDKPANTR